MDGRGGDRLSAAMGRVYRALLVAYPKGFRRDYGEEMEMVFEDRCREAREGGGVPALASLAGRTLLDLTVTVAEERSEMIGRGLSARIRWQLYREPAMLGKGFVWFGAVMLALQLLFNAFDFDGLIGMLPGLFFWSFFVLIGAGDAAMHASRGRAAVLLRSAALLCAGASVVAGVVRDYGQSEMLLLFVNLGIALAILFVVLSVLPGRRNARG